jgi:hypothetical protein
MSMFQTLRFIALAAVMPVALASAQVVRPIPQIPSAARAVERALEKGKPAVLRGKTVDADTTPVPNARVRLRNLGTREVEHIGMANTVGEFSFVMRPETPYVVEVANEAGRVIAVGDVIVAHAGDVASAVVALPTRVSPLAGAFAETKASVVSAAADSGIATVETEVLPLVSPEK